MTAIENGRCLPTNGVLKKWTNYVSGWQDRYFEIKNGKLLYYKSKNDKAYGCRGAFSLKSAIVQGHEFDECELLVSTSVDSIWYLKAENRESRELWIKALSRDYGDSDYSSSSIKSHSRNPSVSSFSLQCHEPRLHRKSELDDNLDARVAELEAYKVLCCDQMVEIEKLVDGCSNGAPSTSTLALKATHLAMIDNVNRIIALVRNGHSIPPSMSSPPLSALSSDVPMSSGMITPDSPINLTVPPRKEIMTVVTSDGEGEDEFHDADDNSMLGSVDEAKEARERESRESSVDDTLGETRRVETVEKKNSVQTVQRHLPFGCFDSIHLSSEHGLFKEVDDITTQQLNYAMESVVDNTWTLFAEDGEMKMFKREVEMDGLPVDPLKALHHVKGVSALEYMHYFFDAKYKKDWDHTLDGLNVVEKCAEDTAVVHQKHKTIWPAASRESLFWSHLRRADHLKNPDASDLYIVCNKDVIREDIPLGSSSAVRVRLTVSMVCQTLIKNGKAPHECTRDDVSCRIFYVSCVHPGGWVPTSALRQVYKREYPKFLRTFTDYVLKNVKGKPLAI